MFRYLEEKRGKNLYSIISPIFIQISMYSQNLQSRKTCLNITKTTTEHIDSEQLCLKSSFQNSSLHHIPRGAQHLGQHIQHVCDGNSGQITDTNVHI